MKDISASRLQSLDFFRGGVMFILIAEFSGLFEDLLKTGNSTLTKISEFLFHHASWEGLHFWDLIQPFFMFIVGVSIPFSYTSRLKRGESVKQIRKHAYRRSFLLLLFGWALYCISPGKIIFQFDNVLAQLSVTYLIAFLLLHKSVSIQLMVSILFILISDGLYRFFPVEGFNNAFTAGENFGAWFNIFISGYEYGGHWAAFNAIPTTAHTIWGLMAGQLLMQSTDANNTIKKLLFAGIACLIVGYAFQFFTPVIKRITTTSFIFLSGAWTILALLFSYWAIDVKGYLKKTLAMRIVGMNPIFIYLFASVGGAALLRRIFKPYTETLIGSFSSWWADFTLSSIVLFCLWYCCFWLYQKRIFFKI